MLSRPPGRRRRRSRLTVVPATPLPPPRRQRPSLVLLGLGGLALLWLSRGWWWPTPPPPQMILVLGGDRAREAAAARLARADGLPVVVSGGTNPEYAQWLFLERGGLSPTQLQLDYRARDTLGNFTSLVDDLRHAHIRHALLVTSSDHMERALLVGRIVAGSRGIHLTPVPIPCADQCVRESRRKIWGDGLRAALWVLSGRDLRGWAAEHLGPWLERAGLRGSGPRPGGG